VTPVELGKEEMTTFRKKPSKPRVFEEIIALFFKQRGQNSVYRGQIKH